MAYRSIILDLDGTLVDSTDALTCALNEVLVSLGRRELSAETVRKHADHGLRALLREACHLTGLAMSDGTLNRHLSTFRLRYDACLVDKTILHSYVLQTLDELVKLGKRFSILTNKPTEPCLKLVKHFGLDLHTDYMVTGDMELLRKPDPAGLLCLLEQMGADVEEALFVGSGRVDVHTARNANVRIALCSPRADMTQLTSMGSDYVLADLRQLTAIVAG
ncbi:MAG TPA: hypothetical protein DCQ06_04535 [Myxococcales bacterium]|nr:hypothetical protein [Myxococcales bacterium]HAN30843.1 hypothetical protein [Myxococcales bacterium]